MKENLSMVAERGGEVPGQATRVTGFEDIILERGSDWQEFRNGLLRSVRLETFTADAGKKALLKLVKELVEFLNNADNTEVLSEAQTAVVYRVIIQKEGMKGAAEYVILQALEKSTTEVRMMVEEAEEDVLKLWTVLSETWLVLMLQNTWRGYMSSRGRRWRPFWNWQHR